MALTSDLSEEFRTAFGSDPDGVWSAPGRVNLIGEHTDYNGGFVLPFAIDKRTRAAVRITGGDRFEVVSSLADTAVIATIADLDSDSVPGWARYVLGVAKVLDPQGPGAQIYIDSEVPMGAGLSSSAALESSVASALNDLWGLGLSRSALASAGQKAENLVVGTPTGIMDQSASMLGVVDSAILLDCRSLETQIIPLHFHDEGLVLLIVDTREEHSHAANGYAARRASCERGAQALGVEFLREVGSQDLEAARAVLDPETYRRVRHVVTENERVISTVSLLREGHPEKIGPLLLESHESLRDDFEVTTPRLDLVVDAAMASGAVGARMTGGGFGGSAIVLVHEADTDHVAAHIRARFAQEGFPEPHIFAAVASEGARRDF